MDYATLASKATLLLSTLGEAVSLSRAGSSIGKAYAVTVARKREDLQGSSLPNVSYTAGDVRSLILSAGKLVPQVGDVVTYRKTQLTIDRVEEVNPAGTTLIWKVEVR